MPREQERNYYLETLARMEQDIAMVDLAAAAASIAISLRRPFRRVRDTFFEE